MVNQDSKGAICSPNDWEIFFLIFLSLMLLYMFVMIPNGSTSERIHAGGYGSEYVFLKWMMKSSFDL